jgi:hypothetical protein
MRENEQAPDCFKKNKKQYEKTKQIFMKFDNTNTQMIVTHDDYNRCTLYLCRNKIAFTNIDGKNFTKFNLK